MACGQAQGLPVFISLNLSNGHCCCCDPHSAPGALKRPHTWKRSHSLFNKVPVGAADDVHVLARPRLNMTGNFIFHSTTALLAMRSKNEKSFADHRY